MQKKIFWKFLLVYIAIGLAGFLLISTLGSHLMEQELVTSHSKSMYKEATEIAAYQGTRYFTQADELEDMYDKLAAVADFQGGQIWLINTKGEILVNSDQKPTGEYEKLEGFDPIDLGSDYYTIGHFFHYFCSKMLSVMVPVSSNMKIRG